MLKLPSTLSRRECILLLWTTLLIGLHLVLQFTYQFNFPVNADDVIICVHDFNQYLKQETSLFDYLFTRKNNNPTLIQRLIVAGNYLISGKVNFATISFISNLGFLAFVAYLTYTYRDNKLSFLIPFILLVPSSRYIYWGSISSAYPYTLMLFYLAMLIILKSKSWRGIIWTLITLPFLTFSFSNGFLALVLLIPLIIFQFIRKKLEASHSIVLLIAILLCIFWFFSGHDWGSPGVLNQSALLFPFVFAGSWGKYFSSSEYWSSFVLSVIFLALLIPIVLKHWKKENVSIGLLMLLFIYGSGLAAGYGRCVYQILCTPTDARYELFGSFTLVFVILLASDYYRYSILLTIPVLLIGYNKTIYNLDKLAIEAHQYQWRQSIAYFKDLYIIPAFQKNLAVESQGIYKDALANGLVSLKVRHDLDVDIIYPEGARQLNKVNFKLTSFLRKNELEFIGGKIIGDHYTKYYIKKENGYALVHLRMHPLPSKSNEFFVILPKIKKSDFILFGESLKEIKNE